MLKYAAAAALAAVLASKFTSQPPPYDDGAASLIKVDARLLAGNAHGAPFPPVYKGKWALNDRLTKATRLFEGQVEGSESVATLSDGTLLTVDKYGWVWTAPRGATKATMKWYVGPGRPLGFHAVDDQLYVACSLKGLLKLDMATGQLEVLANLASDTNLPLNYVNDLDVAPSGDVYFTSSTERGVLFNARKGFYDTLHSYLQNLCKGDNTGRLLKYDAATRTTSTLLSGLWYANGVALSADFKDVLVVETNLNRVHRYSLTTGKTEVFVDKIPAMPDGVSRSADGGFWIGGVVRLSPLPRLLAPYPRLRTLVSHIVGPLLPVVAKPAGLVFKVDSSGKPADALYDLSGEYVSSVSAVAQDGDALYLGNLNGDFVSRVELAPPRWNL
jgi:sugar lactone lactonase YvrE